MGRAYGSNAVMAVGVESTYGTPPAGTAFKLLPFVTSNIGEEQNLLDDNQLGGGREGFDPVLDVINDVGDIVVPVETDAIGYWLKGLLGAPTNTGSGTVTHVFTSGATSLPSLSVEIGNPEVPNFSLNYGVMVNQLRVQMARSGLLNATVSVIAQGENAHTSSSAATSPATVAGSRFAQGTGQVSKDGSALANVTAADFVFSNGGQTVETIRSDGRIGGVDPGIISMTGTLTLLYADNVLIDASAAGTPVAVGFGWTNGSASLLFAMPRVFLPKPKRTISGPNGIAAQYNIRASGKGGHTLTATLVNGVVSY